MSRLSVWAANNLAVKHSPQISNKTKHKFLLSNYRQSLDQKIGYGVILVTTYAIDLFFPKRSHMLPMDKCNKYVTYLSPKIELRANVGSLDGGKWFVH